MPVFIQRGPTKKPVTLSDYPDVLTEEERTGAPPKDSVLPTVGITFKRCDSVLIVLIEFFVCYHVIYCIYGFSRLL